MSVAPYQIEVTFTASCDNCIHQGLCEHVARKGRLCSFWRGNKQADRDLAENVSCALSKEVQKRNNEEKLKEARAVVAAYEEKLKNPTEEDVENARKIIAEIGEGDSGD